jgi:cytochrome c oxidase assembly protein subunit 15
MAGITVGAVIFLILVGALVRMTGSGMGCPDWPKCFGQWVPPTDISQLPADYKIRFQVAGKEIADFDPYKTWIEYINRLIGVLIGLFALITAALSLPLRRIDPWITRWSVAGLVLVILQGGLGAYVVRTNLKTGIITLHMLMALLVLAAFMAAWMRTLRTQAKAEPGLFRLSLAALLLTLVQILLGTQVREQIDELAIVLGSDRRAEWIAGLDALYDVHKVFYYAIAAAAAAVWWQGRRAGTRTLRLLSWWLPAVVLAEVLLGLGMHHLAVPAVFQPLHLLAATLLFAGFFLMAGLTWPRRPDAAQST